MKYLFLSLLFGSLLWATCNKDDPNPYLEDADQLPPITMEGKNTFGCLVNGAVWRNTPKPFNQNLSGEYHAASQTFQIHASQT